MKKMICFFFAIGIVFLCFVATADAQTPSIRGSFSSVMRMRRQARLHNFTRLQNKTQVKKFVNLSLEGKKVLEATREHTPPHYHVAVFPNQYTNYIKNKK